jgi:hypothetical protein
MVSTSRGRSIEITHHSEIVGMDDRFRAIETIFGDIYAEIIKLENKVREEREKLKSLTACSKSSIGLRFTYTSL